MTDSQPGGVANRDIPQTADANAKPSSGVVSIAKRAHRFLVPVLLVLATIIGIAATFAVWVNRQWARSRRGLVADAVNQQALLNGFSPRHDRRSTTIQAPAGERCTMDHSSITAERVVHVRSDRRSGQRRTCLPTTT